MQNNAGAETCQGSARQVFHVKHAGNGLFANAETAEYLAQQVISGKFTGN